MSKKEFPTIIALVRGKGTRLYPLTLDVSKSLIAVANVPTLERTFETFAKYGCRDFWIIGEYDLYNYFRNGEAFSSKLGLTPPTNFYYTTEEDQGNADGIRIALEKKHKRTHENKITGEIVVVSGDSVIDLDFQQLMEMHRNDGADMTVVLKEVEDVSPYGVAKVEADRIVDFIEKPKPNESPSKLINTFINVVSANTLREVFLEMKSKSLEATDFGSHIIPYMTKNHVVRPYTDIRYWEDLGTPKTLMKANLNMLQGTVESVNLEPRIHPTSELSIGHNVDLDGVLVGANVTIGDNCKLHHACIESNVIIEDNVSIEDAVIYFNAKVGRGCTVIKSIIDRFAYTGEETQVGDYEPDETTVIGAYTRLGNRWRIWPGELVTSRSSGALEQIVDAKRNGSHLYKIVGIDEENLYFVNRVVLERTYGNSPPSIFKKIT